MRRRRAIVGGMALLALAACDVPPPPAPAGAPPVLSAAPVAPKLAPEVAARTFVEVVARLEPVAEAECRVRRGGNCDFLIAVDEEAGDQVNAFQTLDPDGRPVIVFTPGLIAEARNADELAFVLGHEAAHHIEDHIPQTQQQARSGALLAGLAAAVLTSGADPTTQQNVIDQALRAGAFVGARRYSKEHELEADALGTVITKRGGYDPLRGALFFERLPDPGDEFLGSHPRNADRLATVRRVAAGL